MNLQNSNLNKVSDKTGQGQFRPTGLKRGRVIQLSSLIVNVDMVAALREIRGFAEPDPAHTAVLADLAGASGIAIQLRKNRRFIRDRDLYILKGIVKTKFILEMPPIDDIIDKALEVKPWMVTLMADHASGDGPVSPVDLISAEVDFSDLVRRFEATGIHVGFFIDPEVDQIKGVTKAGGAAILINCSGYSTAQNIEQAQVELDRIDRAVTVADKSGLAVHCGRGITYRNVRPLVELGLVDEFVIGNAICSRAMLVGYERAVREMVELIHSYPEKG